ncbi:MAG: alpha/beta fold hydrolase [Polaromonas sp.]|nr:alpha/beta fold hydrolase [Polaromonas sp.]
MKLRANGIDIEIEDSHAGDTTGLPVVLLIMGLGMQLVAWPPALVQSLVDTGYRVVRLDNRDIGLSQKFDHLGLPNLLWEGLKYKLGLPVKSPYSLGDMAADTLAVLDALGVAKAHVVGVSMGGMIAQRVAIAAPERVLSLTSIMSSSGARGLPQAKPQVMRVLMSRPAGKDAESVLNHYVKLFKAIGSPGFPMDDAELRERIAAAAKRSFYPAGTVRQMAAIAADSQRAHALGGLRVPTLVIHGKADPLVPYACGVDTARRIPGATLVGIEGMGHDLPAGVVQRILEPLIPHLNTAQGAKT